MNGGPDFPMGEPGKDEDIGLSVPATWISIRKTGSGAGSNQVDLGVSSALTVSPAEPLEKKDIPNYNSVG
jgi:hypothetical protein